jgi:hypothetical protein
VQELWLHHGREDEGEERLKEVVELQHGVQRERRQQRKQNPHIKVI